MKFFICELWKSNIILNSKFFVVLFFDFRASEETGSTGSNQTSLLTGNGLSGHTRSVTDMGMVTTTVGMVNGVHVHGFDLGPAGSSDFMFMIRDSGLQNGLLGSTSTSDNTDHSSRSTGNSLSRPTGESHSGLTSVFGMTNDGAIGAGGSGKVSYCNFFYLCWRNWTRRYRRGYLRGSD